MNAAFPSGMRKIDHLKIRLKLILIEMAEAEDLPSYDLRGLIEECFSELTALIAAEKARDQSHLRLVQ